MSEQFTMFDQTTCEDTANATSSPVLESGATACVKQHGRTIGKSGRDPVRASPSAQPGKVRRSTTTGIFGQSGFFSSESDDLSFALASRLRPLTDSLGSTLYSLTWITRITPQGRSICALRASEPRTRGSVCIGWPTPRAACSGPDFAIDNRETSGGFSLATVAAASWPTPSATDGRRGGSQTEKMTGSSLAQWAKMAGWPTPKLRDFRSENEAALDREGHPPDLNKLALLAGWPTARAEDAESAGTRKQRGVADTMTAVAALTAWRSPNAVDAKLGRCQGQGQIQLCHEARLTAFGETPIGFLLGPKGWEIVPASGQLNAGHSRWLMGLPDVWDDCGVTAMASLRRSRRPSSRRARTS